MGTYRGLYTDDGGSTWHVISIGLDRASVESRERAITAVHPHAYVFSADGGRHAPHLTVREVALTDGTRKWKWQPEMPARDRYSPDRRYSVRKEFTGAYDRVPRLKTGERYVARFCGEWIGAATTEDAAWELFEPAYCRSVDLVLHPSCVH